LGFGTALAAGGLSLLAGDATFNLNTRRDLVLQDVADAGRAPQMSGSAYENGGITGGGQSWFSLWTERTAVDLFSAGGNLTPLTSTAETDMAAVYPATLRAVAASGSLFYGRASSMDTTLVPLHNTLVLAPSASGQLQLLAADSIYGGELSISRSSAAPSTLATIRHPAFQANNASGLIEGSSNLSSDGNIADIRSALPLFVFGPNTASLDWGNALEPARFYALRGDLLGVNSGRTITMTGPYDPRFGQTYYEGAAPVWMLAGRDIVSSGTRLGGGSGGDYGSEYTYAGNLFVHHNASDISIARAGRDIIYSSFNVAGPGTLEVTAGRDIRMNELVGVTSIGAVVPGDSRAGANIVMQAGAGPDGPDYRRFVAAYLDPANLLAAGEALSIQGGKVVKTYENELVTWLGERFGFVGNSTQAGAYYAALPAEQQRIFARDVYFAELKAAGREYNQSGGVRQGSYVRGRAAIAALFSGRDAAGNVVAYQGDITMFGGAGVHTDFGGNIQMLTPGGNQTFGIEGGAPPATAGIITQGAGDIQMYAMGSILLGQSRVMTTFGGSILGWSATGDINAGRGFQNHAWCSAA